MVRRRFTAEIIILLITKYCTIYVNIGVIVPRIKLTYKKIDYIIFASYGVDCRFFSGKCSQSLRRCAMPTIIKVNCTGCGEVSELDAGVVKLVLYQDDPDRNYYSFVCSFCKRYNMKHADEEIVQLIEVYVGVTRFGYRVGRFDCTCADITLTEHDARCFLFDLDHDDCLVEVLDIEQGCD